MPKGTKLPPALVASAAGPAVGPDPNNENGENEDGDGGALSCCWRKLFADGR